MNNKTSTLTIRRLIDAPSIGASLLPGESGNNINGPSILRCPEWIPHRLGKYYCYFAHHRGDHIRLAYADSLTGPWQLYTPGAIHLRETPFDNHIASPDIQIDTSIRKILLRFHGSKHPDPSAPSQVSCLAESDDGIHFIVNPDWIGGGYLRCWNWNNETYAIGWGGRIFKSPDGISRFQVRPESLGPEMCAPYTMSTDRTHFFAPRHAAVHHHGNAVDIYYSRIGDNPERILRVRMILQGSWLEWKAGPVQEVLRPERIWEGANLPQQPSRPGLSRNPVNELRDPCIFVDNDNRCYLAYSCAGEHGIGMAEISDYWLA